MKIGIILGSIRDGRVGESVGAWVAERAAERSAEREGVEYELVDLKSFDLPLLTNPTHPAMANREYGSEAVNAWGRTIDGLDGFVFVTPEYNHGVPGAMKNAVDSIMPEWVGKAVAFVAYGSVGGVRAIEQWRQVIANFSMVDVRAEVNLNLFTDFGDNGVTPQERHNNDLDTVFTQLEAATASTAAQRG